MNQDEAISLFRQTGALLDGHFILRSGLHSRHFFQCALLMKETRIAERICAALSALVPAAEVDAVISPALGGIIVGHEVGRALGKKHIFAEKEEGKLVLRRGFTIAPSERFLVAEDVVTQGGRVRETLDIVRQHGGIPVGVATIVHRGAEEPDFGCPFYKLIRLQVETFEADNLPPDLAGTPAIKPGSK